MKVSVRLTAEPFAGAAALVNEARRRALERLEDQRRGRDRAVPAPVGLPQVKPSNER